MVREYLGSKRCGNAAHSWYVDETHIKVSGRWCYLYGAIDRGGKLLDSILRQHCDREAARRFLRRLIGTQKRRPLRLTTDKHPAHTKAIRKIVSRKKVQHRQNKYQNNRMEQHHRMIKQHSYPMPRFGRFEPAGRL